MSQHWNEVPNGVAANAARVFFNAFGDKAGIVASHLANTPAYANELAAKVRGDLNLPTAWGRASQIMAGNFFGLQECEKYFGIERSEGADASMRDIPFTEETLLRCRETHFLVAVPGMSLAMFASCLRKRELGHLLERSKDQFEKKFSTDFSKEGWFLFRKTPVEASVGHISQTQRELLGRDEYVPVLRHVVFAIISYYLMTGEHLFKDERVNCAEYDAPFAQQDITQPITVGLFGPKGLFIGSSYWQSGVGLASAIAPVFSPR